MADDYINIPVTSNTPAMADDHTNILKYSNVPTFIYSPDGSASFMMGWNPRILGEHARIEPVGHAQMRWEVGGKIMEINTPEHFKFDGSPQAYAEIAEVSGIIASIPYISGELDNEGVYLGISRPSLSPGLRDYGYDTITFGLDIGDVFKLAVTFFPLDRPTILPPLMNMLFEDALTDDDPDNDMIMGFLNIDFSAGDQITISDPIVFDPDGVPNGQVPFSELTVCGEPVVWAPDPENSNILVGTADGEIVATFEVDTSSGKYIFTLLKAVDHPDAGIHGSEIRLDDQLGLEFRISVVDKSGHITEQSVTIFVKDDGPDSVETSTQLIKGDNDVITETEALIEEKDINGESVLIHGELNVDFGADGSAQPFGITGIMPITTPATVMDPDAPPEEMEIPLTVCGVEVVFGGATMTTIDMGSGPIEVWELIGTVDLPDDGKDPIEVMRLTVEKAGDENDLPEYWFELLHAIDHPDAGMNGEGVGFDDQLLVKFKYETTDKDGDTQWNLLTITVNDDGPTTTDITVIYDETEGEQGDEIPINEIPENLANILDELGLSGDMICGVACKDLIIDYGEDGPAVEGITDVEALVFKDISEQSYSGKTTVGETITLEMPDGQTIVGMTDSGVAWVAYLDVENEQAYFVQYEALFHDSDKDEGEVISIDLGYTVTDKDGDSVMGNV
ncbi:MAG: DUF5801 repeats-in-toxin domain-containing protein, partial [Gammaproteobacteria bacterium]